MIVVLFATSKKFFYNALNNKVLLLNISVLTYNKQHIYYSI